MPRFLRPAALLAFAALHIGCTGDDTSREGAPPDAASPPHNPFGILLTDVTESALGGKIQGGCSLDNHFGIGTGAALGDLDGDGDLDLVLARNDDPLAGQPGGPSRLLRNDGLGRFTIEPAFSALFPKIRAHGVALGDFDRDGDLDIFLAAEGRDYLLANDGAGHFSDATALAGVGGRDDDMSLGALFADLNHDGLLDLYVANFNPKPAFAPPSAKNRLHLNLGDGRFADSSAASATDGDAVTLAAAACDLDGQGDLALYVANDRYTTDGKPGDPAVRPDAWYHLDAIDGTGVPHFRDLAEARGTVAHRSSMAITIADFDGDLTPDLYIADVGRNSLYLNQAPGAPLIERAAAYGLEVGFTVDHLPLISWGSRVLDLDRDGLPELLIQNGFFAEPLGCESYHQVPAFLRRPAAFAPYQPITDLMGMAVARPECPGGVGDPERVTGRAVVQGDLDGDGDDDLILTGFAAPFFVYRNDTPRLHHALRVRLRGTVSSPDPIGATLIVTDLSGRRQARFRSAGGDPQSQSDGVLEVGLASDAAVARAEVRWPSGLTQRIDPLPIFALDRTITVVEPEWLTVLPRRARPGDPAPRLVYRPASESGLPLGKSGAGRKVSALRSDGIAVAIVDHGDGTYSALLPHPGIVRRTVLTLTVDGQTQRPRPMLSYE
ncbi:MAG: CRTAC1 family protein [Myxococcales bacterium]|nr:CRTAC1 family protein [Myxococcales bacterium]